MHIPSRYVLTGQFIRPADARARARPTRVKSGALTVFIIWYMEVTTATSAYSIPWCSHPYSALTLFLADP